MNRHDQTAEILKAVDLCPECSTKLVQIDRSLIRCETCGFKMRVANQHTDDKLVLASGVFLGVVGTLILALELFIHAVKA